jgi:hypothetical protein
MDKKQKLANGDLAAKEDNPQNAYPPELQRRL